MSFRSAIAAVALTAATLVAQQAAATPAGMVGPIQTYAPPFGAAHRTTVESYIETTYAPGSNVTFLGRLSFNDTSNGFGTEEGYAGITLTATCANPSDCKSGTWTLSPGSTGFLVSYLEINGGSTGALYDVIPDALTGVWNTNDLFAGNSENHPQISHLDFWGSLAGTPPTNVPEPATLSLLGAGLFGIGMLRRRRNGRTA